jgi:hypothetical protein
MAEDFRKECYIAEEVAEQRGFGCLPSTTHFLKPSQFIYKLRTAFGGKRKLEP